MKVAALDLGTNTFLCLLAEGDQQGNLRVYKDLVEVVRLGQGVGQNKSFHPEALERAQSTLEKFKKEIDLFKPDRILAVATSAARDAKNGHALFAIGDALDIPIEVIDGKKEAEVSFVGALEGFQVHDETVAVIDIGGGSTEVIVGQNGKVFAGQSVDIGGVRLTEKFIPQQPVPAADFHSLQKEIQQQIKIYGKTLNLSQAKKLFAVAGTPTTLAALELGGFISEKVDGFRFSRERLQSWQKIFAETSVEEKIHKYQLGGRADIIFVGTTILIEVMKMYSFNEVIISSKGVRFGVARLLLDDSTKNASFR